MIACPRPWPNYVAELLGSPLSWLSPAGLAPPMAMTLGSPLPWQLCSSRWCQLPHHPAVYTDIWSLEALHLLPCAHFALCKLATQQLFTNLWAAILLTFALSIAGLTAVICPSTPPRWLHFGTLFDLLFGFRVKDMKQWVKTTRGQRIETKTNLEASEVLFERIDSPDVRDWPHGIPNIFFSK